MKIKGNFKAVGVHLLNPCSISNILLETHTSLDLPQVNRITLNGEPCSQTGLNFLKNQHNLYRNDLINGIYT